MNDFYKFFLNTIAGIDKNFRITNTVLNDFNGKINKNTRSIRRLNRQNLAFGLVILALEGVVFGLEKRIKTLENREKLEKEMEKSDEIG